MNKPIMPIVYECAYLGKTGTVPVAPYGRAGTVDLAEKAAEVMKEYDCCLMESHGAIAADKDMDAAFLKGPSTWRKSRRCIISLCRRKRGRTTCPAGGGTAEVGLSKRNHSLGGFRRFYEENNKCPGSIYG